MDGILLREGKPPAVDADAARQSDVPPQGRSQNSLAGLHPIRLEDANRFAAAAEAGRVVSWSHFFPYLFFSGKPDPRHRLLHEFVDGSALVYRLEMKKGKQRLSRLLAPFPFAPAALAQARDRMHAFNGKGQAASYGCSRTRPCSSPGTGSRSTATATSMSTTLKPWPSSMDRLSRRSVARYPAMRRELP